MYLKLPVNSFLVGVHERENVCISDFIFFADTCVIESSKFDVCETLMLALFLSVNEENFWKIFFFLACFHFDPIFLSRYFSSMLRYCEIYRVSDVSCF